MIKTILVLISFVVAFTSKSQNVFEKNDKYGLQDSTGKTIVRAKYDEIDEFIKEESDFFGIHYNKKTVTRVKEKNKWGIINSKGKEIIEPFFDFIEKISPFNSTNLLDVQLNGKWGIYDFNGKEIVAPKYEKQIDVTFKSKYSIVYVVQSTYVSSGLQNNLYGVLDSNYKEIIALKYGFLGKTNFDYFKVRKPKDDLNYGLIDLNENVIFDFKYEDIFPMSNDVIAIKKNKKWILYNKKGYSINSNEYEKLAIFKGSRAMVFKQGKYGYIDEKGKEVIPCIYDKAANFFYEGKARVKLNDQAFDIDIYGKELTTLETIKPRDSLKFIYASHKKAFDLINFKQNVADSANLKLVAKYLEIGKTQLSHEEYINLIDNLISEASNNKIAYKVFANYLYNRFTVIEYVCHDAILVHIALKYYCDEDAPYGGAYWLDNKAKNKIFEDAKLAQPSLCGQIVPNFNLKLLPQINTKYIKLNSIKSNYTILFFWINDCKSCDEKAKTLIENYASLKENGVEIVGISLSAKAIDKCEQLIVQNEMNWINVIDFDLAISKKFNLTSVPKIYLLDKDKRIIQKNISPQQLINYINY